MQQSQCRVPCVYIPTVCSLVLLPHLVLLWTSNCCTKSLNAYLTAHVVEDNENGDWKSGHGTYSEVVARLCYFGMADVLVRDYWYCSFSSFGYD